MGNCISNSNICNQIFDVSTTLKKNNSKSIEVFLERKEIDKANNHINPINIKNSKSKNTRDIRENNDPKKFKKYCEIYEKNYIMNIIKIQKSFRLFKIRKELIVNKIYNSKIDDVKINFEEQKENNKGKFILLIFLLIFS